MTGAPRFTTVVAVLIMMTAAAWASDTELGNALWGVLTALWNFVVVFEEAAWNEGLPLSGLAIGAVMLPVLFGLNCSVQRGWGRDAALIVFLGATAFFFVTVSVPMMLMLTYIHTW
jgi:hypothetical protein